MFWGFECFGGLGFADLGVLGGVAFRLSGLGFTCFGFRVNPQP